MARLSLEFENKTDVKVKEELFGDFVESMVAILGERLESYLGERESILALYMVKDKEIRKLNREFRDKDKATDVLSFPYVEDGAEEVYEGVVLAGEIFISTETAARQAEEKGHSLEKELSILFVHGMLHVFGFDHNTDEEEAEMEGWAEKILK